MTTDVKRSDIKVLLLLGLLALCGYFFALQSPFKTMDDYQAIISNPNIKDIRNIPTIFTTSFFGFSDYWRPAVFLSYMLEYHLFGLNAFFYYLDNVLLHILCGFLVFKIINRIAKDELTAVVSAVLFVIHPVQSEAVANVSGRSMLLCGVFFLLAFDLFVVSWEDQKHRRKYLAMSLLSFIAAMLSKESAVMLPFILMAYMILIRKQTAVLKSTWPYFAVIALYILIRRFLGITAVFSWSSLEETVLGVITFLKGCLIFLKNLVYPVDLYYDSSLELFADLSHPQVGTVVAVWALIGTALFLRRKNITAVAWFFISWVVINLVTVSQIVPVKIDARHISVADHFLYLPSAGIFFLLTSAARAAYRKVNVTLFLRYALSLGFLAFMLLTTVQQSFLASNQLAMFERSLEHYPKNMRVLAALAIAYAFKGKPEQAEILYRRMLAIEPRDVKARIGLGKVLCDQNKCWDALAEMEKIKDPGPLARIHRAKIDEALSRLERTYQDIIEGDHENAQAYYSLGVVYSKMNRIEDALRQFQIAVTLQPDYRNALFNLGVSYDILGDKEKAQEYIQKARQLE